MGMLALFDKHWFIGSWHKQFTSGDIIMLELFPIMLYLEIWGESLANQCVLLFTDNEALVSII